jgi:hypothetical protein
MLIQVMPIQVFNKYVLLLYPSFFLAYRYHVYTYTVLYQKFTFTCTVYSTGTSNNQVLHSINGRLKQRPKRFGKMCRFSAQVLGLFWNSVARGLIIFQAEAGAASKF